LTSPANHPQLILASASPRRGQLLRQLGLRFEVIPAAVDERVQPGEAPGDYVRRVARDKAVAVWRRSGGERPVLAADTAVVLDGDILGKPVDRADAAYLLGRLSGATHEVYSAVAVAAVDGRLHESLNVTRVTFAALHADWIESYIDTGDPMDKAGAYGVQGRAAARITRIDGSFSGVMGLPLYETCELLQCAEVLF
jgi:nucleoside triphosphate pyrophosphatase